MLFVSLKKIQDQNMDLVLRFKLFDYDSLKIQQVIQLYFYLIFLKVLVLLKYILMPFQETMIRIKLKELLYKELLDLQDRKCTV